MYYLHFIDETCLRYNQVKFRCGYKTHVLKCQFKKINIYLKTLQNVKNKFKQFRYSEATSVQHLQLRINKYTFIHICGLPRCTVVSAGDPGSIPGLGRSPGEGNGNPLQYSCLENSTDSRDLRAIQSMGSQRAEYH